MRSYREPTCGNFLREPLVLGVHLLPLLLVVFLAALIQVLGSVTVAAAVLGFGYVTISIHARYARVGAEESLLFFFEEKLGSRVHVVLTPLESPLKSPDTLTEEDQLTIKSELEDNIRALKGGGLATLSIGPQGAVYGATTKEHPHVYSLYRLPSHTDPNWISAVLREVREGIVLIRIDSVDLTRAKKMAQRARRQSAQLGDGLIDIDSAVTFEESSAVLEGLSRGTEALVRISLVITSSAALDLHPDFFYKEKNSRLSVLAATGARRRPHRSHYVRLPTAVDLIPSFLDPLCLGSSFMRSRRGTALEFSPLDLRLGALHWLVVGATGSGKSVLTGLILSRLVSAGENVSVLFIDHNRGFKRLCGKKYLEPSSFDELKASFNPAVLNKRGQILGVELSDLATEKKSASAFLLKSIEGFLRTRSTTHTVFLVLDECWNFLRDEPVLVQTAYREYRKLNGAMVAITHSISDFASTENGQSILQNAPVRILLRQAEDMLPHQSALGLNCVEFREVRYLRQKHGEFSECLVKTPFSSQIGRIYPTPEEFEILRTDNLRREV